MKNLFTRTFVDEWLHEKISVIQQFVRPENLDIKPT